MPEKSSHAPPVQILISTEKQRVVPSFGYWGTSRIHTAIYNINVTMGTFNAELLATGRSNSSWEFTFFDVKVVEVGPAPKP